VMTASDFVRADVWATITRQGHTKALQKELRDELGEAVARRGVTLPAERLVTLFLDNAPTAVNATAVSIAVAGQLGLQSGVARKAVWSQLKAAGQLSPSWLLLIFRLLWYRKLTERGWVERDIVSFLGLRATRQLRLQLKRRLGTSIRALRRMPYEAVLDWAVQACADGQAPGTRSHGQLVAGLAERSARPV
jgi:hypothetical protein